MTCSRRLLFFLAAVIPFNLPLTQTCCAQQKPAAAKSSPGRKKVAPARQKAALAVPPKILTNESVIQMVDSGRDAASIIAAIQSSPAKFQMDGDHLVQLHEHKVPGPVLRAMLAKKAPEDPAPAPKTENAEPVAAAHEAPVPPAPVRAPVPDNLDHALAREGSLSVALSERPQRAVFVKSESTNAKEAIANLLLSDVGLSLLTMGLAPQMKMWNPYFGDTLSKVTSLGKGLLRSRGTSTTGFEYMTLAGATSGVSLGVGRPEFLIPMASHLASADTDVSELQPVLLRLDARDQDHSRLLTARRVTLKETKKGRFDFKPTLDREEMSVEQNAVPVDVELAPNHVYRITPQQDLQPGEYAIVFRRKDASGTATADLPLIASPVAAQQVDELDGGVPQQPRSGRGGLFRRAAHPPTQETPEQGPTAGLLAWDFRILK